MQIRLTEGSNKICNKFREEVDYQQGIGKESERKISLCLHAEVEVSSKRVELLLCFIKLANS